MRLLPDMELDGHIISLQDPLTIDGNLVTDIDVQININSQSTLRIMCEHIRDNHRLYTYNFNYVDFCKLVKDTLIEFTDNYSNGFYFDPRCMYYSDEYIDDLGSHGLIPFNSSNDIFNWYSGRLSTNRDNNIRRLETQRRVSNTGIKYYIHSYDYKPEYLRYFCEDEDPSTTLLLGAEIEVAGNLPEIDQIIKQDVVKKCIQIMNTSDSDEEKYIYSTHDGTVQIELDTMPCSLKFHQTKMNYKEMFKYLDEQGYKGHDCSNAGLHIHANRSYLGKTKLQQELVISKILYIIEKFNDEICVIGRRHTDYSRFVGDRGKDDTAITLFGKYSDEGKKAALNLQHPDTIEFRMFKSTLKYETFLLTLEFVKNIIDYAKSVSIEEIEFASWNDLTKLFSPALNEYYIGRYNKLHEDDQLKKEIKYLKTEITRLKTQLMHKKTYYSRKSINQALNKANNELNVKLKKLRTLQKEKSNDKIEYLSGNLSIGGMNFILGENHLDIDSIRPLPTSENGTITSAAHISSHAYAYPSEANSIGHRAETLDLNSVSNPIILPRDSHHLLTYDSISSNDLARSNETLARRADRYCLNLV